MQQYLNQLLADLKAAQTKQPEKPDYKVLYPDHQANDPIYDGMMDYMIEWDNAPEWKMDDLFEIKSEVFPPVEKLTTEQVTKLIDGILELWAHFNIDAVIPDDKIPVEIVYKELVNSWKTETIQYISEGTLHLEFCHYDENNCPWGYEYCSCKDIEIEDMDNVSDDNTGLNTLDFDGDDLPF